MKVRNLIKIKSNIILTFILSVNVLCVMFITLQSFVILKPNTSSSYVQDQFDSLGNSKIKRDSLISSTASPRSPVIPTIEMTMSPVVLKKVDSMHEDLNITRHSDTALYPAMRIGKYLLLDPNMCSNVDKVHVVIIVHTAPKNLERRQRIRETYAKRSFFYPFNVRVAFLLGKTLNSTLERVLWMEHARYNDTVMGDFIDDYHNLTLKGVMGYRWVDQFCGNSEIVLKIDDDVVINTFKFLYTFLNQMRGKKKAIFCNHWYKGTMPILRTGKWKVDSKHFANMKTFPYDYCSGFIVLISTDLMGPMHQAAMTTPFFWIDDVYLFGMLPKVVGGVTFYNYRLDHQISLIDQKTINCTKEQGAKCPIFGSVIRDRNYYQYWDLVKSLYITTDTNIPNKLVP